MNIRNLPVIPMIFTGAGACLTVENWREVGVSTLSCSLMELGFKPGLEMLFQIKNLPQYLGWSGQWVLNATMPAANREGGYILQSPHDGSRLTILPETILQLIQYLKPDYAILPHEMAKNGDLSFPFIESNQPCEDGFAGILYTHQENMDISDSQMAKQFIPIDDQCTCPTCKQAFTRAYLHHLLANTPLLAQRLLIMHNVYWIGNYKKI
jgi:queuine tRNA-ribosyltransferase